MTAIEHLHALHNNPFLFARAMLTFCASIGDKEHSLLLTYLVLPLALDEESRAVLSRAKSTSNLRTFVGRGERLKSLPDLVAQYREVTNASLRYLVSLNAIKIVGNTIQVPQKDLLSDHVSLDGLDVAARVLGRFFSDHSVPVIYRMVGVRSL